MKLSELSTKEASKVLVKLAAPVARIAGDDAIFQAIKALGNTHVDLGRIEIVASELLPLMLDTHFDDTCSIVATLSEKTCEQIAAQNWMQTYTDAVSAFDSELLRFFKSAGSMMQTK